jgi:glucarate dehydratase
MQLSAAALAASASSPWSHASLYAAEAGGKNLRIASVKATPVALPDPPLLAASGCHGPYFLRTIIEVATDDGFVGIGETYGTQSTLRDLREAIPLVQGQSAFAVRHLATVVTPVSNSVFAGIEMACLDIVGQATGRRVCELLGGPVREDVEFAAYLFYRYAADDPRVLSDERLVDARGKGDRALDPWGEVRSAEAMTRLAAGFREKYGFRVLKLKGGVLEPDEELKTLEMWKERFGDEVPVRIDPNGRWNVTTAISAARDILQAKVPLEYYEDPVVGQSAMADVRAQTGLKMATNMCVTRWAHLEPATRIKPIDVILAEIYGFGGITGCQALGRAAASLGWGVSYHSNNHAGITMAAMIHAGACTPEMTYALDTHYPWLPEGTDVIQGANLKIARGRMQIPTAPGLGVALDRDKLARAHETYTKCGMRNRDDAATMQRFVPGWKRTTY